MTGNSAGPLGGNSGAHFGSGLTSLTQNLKGALFHSNLETWVRNADEDKQVKKLHNEEYHAISTKRREICATREKFKQKSRESANAAFVRQQQMLAEGKAAERAREQVARQEALAKPTLGDPMLGTATNRKRLEDLSVLSEEAVARWIMPTEKRVGDHNMVLEGIGAEHEDAMTTLPQNASKETVDSYVKNIVGNSLKLTREAVETRKHKDAEKARVMALEKEEREMMAESRRAELLKRAKDAEMARIKLEKQIKQALADEARKENTSAMERAKKRYERGLEQRKENLERLHRAETDVLRTDMQIANERREGTSMSKGGRVSAHACICPCAAACARWHRLLKLHTCCTRHCLYKFRTALLLTATNC